MKNPVVISGYRELRSLFKAFADGHLPFVVLLATPGLGKSFNLEKMLKRKGCLFLGGGSMSAYGTYCEIAAHRDKPIVLDDADVLLGNMDGRVLLRALTETRSTKVVRWTKKMSGAVPPEVETKSAVMLIINGLPATERAIPALLSRALFRTFRPDFEEARKEVARWFWDADIFDTWSLLIPWLSKAGPPDMRLLKLAAAAKDGDMDWREDLLAATALGDDDRSIVRLNARRTPEDFNPESIKRVFLVSVLMGEGETYSKMFDEVRGRPVHVVSGASLPILLGELDTVADFVAYLEAKEALFKNGRTRILMEGGEEELLASYLTMGRSFKKFKNKDRVVIEAGSWDHYNQRPEVKAKREEDEVSRGWDHLIDIAHSMHDLEAADRERLSRELARPNRFHRRWPRRCSTAWSRRTAL